MREISATDASRGFAAMLDAVEHEGESFAIRRNGRVVARIEPAVGLSGAAVKALLRSAGRDQDWEADVAALRSSLPAEVDRWER